MKATIGRVYAAAGVGRLVAGLAARQFGLLDLALLDQLGERVVGHRARDLRDVGDLGRAHAGTLADDAQDRLAVRAARRARALLARARCAFASPAARRAGVANGGVESAACSRSRSRTSGSTPGKLALDLLQPLFEVPPQVTDDVAHVVPPADAAREGSEALKKLAICARIADRGGARTRAIRLNAARGRTERIAAVAAVGRARAAGHGHSARRVEAMVARHGPPLLRVANQFSLCHDDALDAYQRALEIYLRSWTPSTPRPRARGCASSSSTRRWRSAAARLDSVDREDVDLDTSVHAGLREVDDAGRGRRARGALGRGAAGAQARRGARAAAQGRGALLPGDRQPLRLDLHEGQPLDHRGPRAVPEGLHAGSRRARRASATSRR